MNKDNAKDYLPFIIALSEGKDIQHNTFGSAWDTLEELSFNTPAHLYRIKPEPVIIRTRRALLSNGKQAWVSILHDLPDYVKPEAFMHNNKDIFVRWIDITWVETEV